MKGQAVTKRLTRQNTESKKLLVVRKETPELHDAFPEYCVMGISSAMGGRRFDSAVIAFAPDDPLEVAAINERVLSLLPPGVKPVIMEEPTFDPLKPYRLDIPLSAHQVRALELVLEYAQHRMKEIERGDDAMQSSETREARETMKQAMPLWAALNLWVSGAKDIARRRGDDI